MSYWLKKEIDVRYIPVAVGRPRWLILKMLDFGIGDKDSNIRIKVPEGFVTDGASVPKLLSNIFPPTGEYLPAAVVHDLLYRTGGYIFQEPGVSELYKIDRSDGPHIMSRKECDNIFKEAMEALKGSDYEVSTWKIHAMYWAVRLFGGSSFNK